MPDEPVLFGFLLVLARVGGALIFVPAPGLKQGPEPVRAVLAVAIALALYPFWPAPAVNGADAGRVTVWLLAEAAFGVTAGLAVAFLTEAFVLASQVFGLQAGYSYASTIDPTTQADSNVLLVFSQLFAGLLFFSAGLHCDLIRVFALSLTAYPPGAYAADLKSAGALIELGAAMFSTGMRLALPVVSFLLLADIALSLLGRVNAQLQLLMLAFPVKMLAALALMAAAAGLYPRVYEGAAQRTWSALVSPALRVQRSEISAMCPAAAGGSLMRRLNSRKSSKFGVRTFPKSRSTAAFSAPPSASAPACSRRAR